MEGNCSLGGEATGCERKWVRGLDDEFLAIARGSITHRGAVGSSKF